jgi:lipopolysaccharide biosynthesis protein/SAM-dependent methyltransferase
MNYGKSFFETYCSEDFSGKIIVDVGSLDVNGSLRQYCPAKAIYIGVDFAEGRGVDVIIEDPYKLPFDSETVDVVVCSSVFEHSDFFWLLFLECIRILKPSGLMYLNAPSNGMVHRFPIDSWRFYPDSGTSLAKWANYNSYNTALLESFVGEKQGPIDGEGIWNDFVAVLIKNQEFASTYPNRIQDLTEIFCHSHDSANEIRKFQYSHVPDHSLIMEQNRTIENLSRTVDMQHQQIENSINEISALKQSTSWQLTEPLRQAKTSALKIAIKTRPVAYKSLRALWRALPISDGKKQAIKNALTTSVQPNAVTLGIPTIKFDSTQESYVDYKYNSPIDPVVKLIAFYLPQFHPFPENDEWWGKGFTEWYNVGRAKKNYTGHYQPHCPIHNGYYDLRIPSVMEEQAKLAKHYGVHGFSYYFYWFAGKILMDSPLEMMLSNPKIDMPFCLTWANENWTRRWDGLENDVLIAQDHSAEDSIAFIQHLVKYFHDSRYIRIDDRPVLIIYRANIIPDIKVTAALWRQEVKKHGIPDLYLICAQSFGIGGPEQFGFDASVEFPPHKTNSHKLNDELNIINPEFDGQIFSYEQVVSNAVQNQEPDYKLLRTPMLSWDNTARKQNTSHCFHGFSLMRYKQWLSAVCSNVHRSKKYSSDEKLVFINAWNEWAEGTHLEPDRKYGYGYLQATYDVISCYDKSLLENLGVQRISKRHAYAVVIHIHYHEVWPEIKSCLDNFKHLGFDLYVTTTTPEAIGMVLADFPDAFIELHENRGRDIFPFTKTLERINEHQYRAVCKLHSKRSVYREGGDLLRRQLLSSLVGDTKTIHSIVRRFEYNSALGMIVPDTYLMAHTDTNMKFNHNLVAYACNILDLSFNYDVFPAGSMFWFKPEALRGLSKLKSSDFDIEHGLADGTLPHAIERVFCLLVKKSGYTVETCQVKN